MSEYLFDNKPVMEVLEKIENIFTIHPFTINPKDNVMGLIMFIIVSITLLVMSLSLVYLPLSQSKYLMIFSRRIPLMISICGTMIIMLAIFAQYGQVTSFKCHLKLVFISLGFTLCNLPTLKKLIKNIPLDNTFFQFVLEHMNIFSFSVFSITTFLNIMIMIVSGFSVEKVIVPEGKNFQKCKLSNGYGEAFYYMLIVWLFIYIVSVLLLIFMEWRIPEMKYDVRLAMVTIFSDLLCFMLIAICRRSNINNHTAYNVFFVCTIYLLSVTDYLLIFAMKILNLIIRSETEQYVIKRANGGTLNITNISNIASISSNGTTTDESYYSKRSMRPSENSFYVGSQSNYNSEINFSPSLKTGELNFIGSQRSNSFDLWANDPLSVSRKSSSPSKILSPSKISPSKSTPFKLSPSII